MYLGSKLCSVNMYLHSYTLVVCTCASNGSTYTCTLLPSNQSFYRQITSHEKGGSVSGVYRPVVRDGNRVQDSCNRLNWGALNHASHALQLCYNYYMQIVTVLGKTTLILLNQYFQ